MTRAWDKENIWVPGRNRTHDLPNTSLVSCWVINLPHLITKLNIHYLHWITKECYMCFNYYCWKLLVFYNVHVEASTGVLSNLCFGWVNLSKRSKQHTPSLSAPDGWQDFLFPLLPTCKFLCLFSYHLISNAFSWKHIWPD